MRIKAKEYLVLMILALIAGIVLLVSFVAMFNDLSGSTHEELDIRGVEIIERTIKVTGQNEEDKDMVIARIDNGMMTLGDYVTKSLTGAEFLLKDTSDAYFTECLSEIIWGDDYKEKDTKEILSMLEDHSRQYVVAEELSNISEDYYPMAKIDDSHMSTFNDCTIDRKLTGSDGYTIGIRVVEGSFDIEGDEVRTDFFVDGTLYQGYLTLDKSDGSSRSFTLAWDTAGVQEGNHKVSVLLRTSDGSGAILDGGDILIPHIMPLINDNVQYGSIQPDSECSWYYLDAKDRNAYVNFVEMSDDIKASLYDAYGELIGSNDIPNMDGSTLQNYEILRGNKQDTELISEETGIAGVSNVFYIKVERGALNSEVVALQNSEQEQSLQQEQDIETTSKFTEVLNYTMVQSKDVTRYDDKIMSVQYNGPDMAILTDLSLNTYEVETSSLKLLPVNGILIETGFVNPTNGNYLNVMPVFNRDTYAYGFYSKEAFDVAINSKLQDGYCGKMEITSVYEYKIDSLQQGQNKHMDTGETVVEITVTDFDGVKNTYTIYFLVGDDDGNFVEKTLSQFPESYYSGLWVLHSLHPDYIFRAYNTGLSFNTVLDNEDNGSRSLANVYSHPGWTVDSSPIYDNGGWKMAKLSVVQYFTDPRNYFDEKHIFAFELQSFDGSCQTVEGVSSMINGSFMDTDEEDYAQIIYDAGKNANVSPYLLSSRIIQEMGYSGLSDLCHGTVPGYEGYYNFYNIGSTPDPNVNNGAVINGAKYAMWGRNPEEKEITEEEAALYLPWDSPRDAIFGGALWIASRYTAQGQDTLYFQKFDVVDDDNGLYEHQYAQNISMAYTEGVRYYESYEAIDMVDSAFTFLIPVYSDMPSSYGVMPQA